MDSAEDLNKTIDLTADDSSSEEDDDDVVITGVSEASHDINADARSTEKRGKKKLPKKILMAEELSASKFVDFNMNTYNAMKAGDLIEFHRGLYTHWGVAIGDGKIVHLSGDEDDGLSANVGGKLGSVSGSVFTISGVNFEKAKVKCDDFWDIARKSKANVNNSKDEYIRADAVHVIIDRALSRMGVIGYNMLWSNCEHFASWCRYGMAWSEQVDKFMRVLDRGKSMLSSAMLLVGITPPYLKPYVAEDENDEETGESTGKKDKFPELEYFQRK